MKSFQSLETLVTFNSIWIIMMILSLLHQVMMHSFQRALNNSENGLCIVKLTKELSSLLLFCLKWTHKELEKLVWYRHQNITDDMQRYYSTFQGHQMILFPVGDDDKNTTIIQQFWWFLRDLLFLHIPIDICFKCLCSCCISVHFEQFSLVHDYLNDVDGLVRHAIFAFLL